MTFFKYLGNQSDSEKLNTSKIFIHQNAFLNFFYFLKLSTNIRIKTRQFLNTGRLYTRASAENFPGGERQRKKKNEN